MKWYKSCTLLLCALYFVQALRVISFTLAPDILTCVQVDLSPRAGANSSSSAIVASEKWCILNDSAARRGWRRNYDDIQDSLWAVQSRKRRFPDLFTIYPPTAGTSTTELLRCLFVRNTHNTTAVLHVQLLQKLWGTARTMLHTLDSYVLRELLGEIEINRRRANHCLPCWPEEAAGLIYIQKYTED